MRHRPEIDGLKAIAVIAIMLFHGGYEWARGGYVGFAAIFILIGYLITTEIMGKVRSDTLSFSEYYDYKIREIFPSLFCVLLVTSAIAWLLMLPGELERFSRHLVAVSLFPFNLLYWRELSVHMVAVRPSEPLFHIWVLALAQQFIIVFPLLIFFLWKFGKIFFVSGFVISCTVALGLFLLATSVGGATLIFYSFLGYAFQLLIGVVLGVYHSFSKVRGNSNYLEQVGSIVGLLLLAYSFYVHNADIKAPNSYAVIPIVGTILIILFANEKNIVGKLLSRKLLVSIGLISYGLYLWHQPILAVGYLVERQSSAELYGTQALLLFVSFGAAYLTWRYVERHFKNRKKINSSVIFTCSILVTLVVTLIGLGGYRQEIDKGQHLTWLDGPIPQPRAPIRDAIGRDCEAEREPDDPCFFPPNSDKPVVALVGDSHAGALGNSLYQGAISRGYGFLDMVHAGCPFLVDLQAFHKHKPVSDCSPKRQIQRLEQLADTEDAIVVMSSRLPLHISGHGFDNGLGGTEHYVPYYMSKTSKSTPVVREEEVRASFFETVRQVLALGHQVVIIDPIPAVGWNPIHRLLGVEARGLGRSFGERLKFVNVPYKKILERQKPSQRVLAGIEEGAPGRTIRISTTDIFCNTYRRGYCSSISPNKFYYFDSHHLSFEGASLVSEAIFLKIDGMN